MGTRESEVDLEGQARRQKGGWGTVPEDGGSRRSMAGTVVSEEREEELR